MKVVFLGATSGMGRALSRLMAARGDQLFILGIDADDLQRSAADLKARSPSGDSEVGTAICDLGQSQDFDPILEQAQGALDGFDTVVVTAGIYAAQEKLEEDPILAGRLLDICFRNTVIFCEAARKRLLAAGGGKLCVFSSVAGDRGRKPVAIYGAAKAGLSHYLESLDHKFRAQGLKTLCVKPGFVKTSMTEGLKPPPFAGEPDAVARRVLKALDKGKPMVYAPATWRWIMLLIQHLPRFVMRRVDF